STESNEVAEETPAKEKKKPLPTPPIPQVSIPDPQAFKQAIREAMQARKQMDIAEKGAGTEGREGATLGTMGGIIAYAANYKGKLGYFPTSLPVLVAHLREERRISGRQPNSLMNVCQAEPCMVHGYSITYTRNNAETYVLQARPIAYPYTGKRSF